MPLQLHADKTTLNPLLNPADSATLSVTATRTDGAPLDLSGVNVSYSMHTLATSGNVEVARLEGNHLIGLEGGVARVTATAVIKGIAHQASLNIVVRPFYREYHQTLTMKLYMGQKKHAVEIFNLTPEGISSVCELDVVNHTITLSLNPKQALFVSIYC